MLRTYFGDLDPHQRVSSSSFTFKQASRCASFLPRAQSPMYVLFHVGTSTCARKSCGSCVSRSYFQIQTRCPGRIDLARSFCRAFWTCMSTVLSSMLELFRSPPPPPDAPPPRSPASGLVAPAPVTALLLTGEVGGSCCDTLRICKLPLSVAKPGGRSLSFFEGTKPDWSSPKYHRTRSTTSRQVSCWSATQPPAKWCGVVLMLKVTVARKRSSGLASEGGSLSSLAKEMAEQHPDNTSSVEVRCSRTAHSSFTTASGRYFGLTAALAGNSSLEPSACPSRKS